MPTKKKTPTRTVMTSQQRASYIIIALIIFVFAYFLVKPYLNVVFLAITFALVLRPVYNRLRYKHHRPTWVAVTITIILAVLLIIIPISILLSSLYGEIAKLLTNFNPRFDGAYVDLAIAYINQGLDSIPVLEYELTKWQIIEVFKQGVQALSGSAVNSALGITQGVISFVTSAFIFFFVLIATLPQQPRIKLLIEKLSPLKLPDTQLYLRRSNAIIVDTIRGSLVIAVVQAALGTGFLFFAGLENLTLLFFLMLIMSLLPVVGTAFVTIPIAIYLILTGDVVTGSLLIIWQLLIMSSIDNVLRPMLVSNDSNIPPVFMLLAILGGIKLFGPIGIIYGPLVMVLFLTTIEIAQKRKLFR